MKSRIKELKKNIRSLLTLKIELESEKMPTFRVEAVSNILKKELAELTKKD